MTRLLQDEFCRGRRCPSAVAVPGSCALHRQQATVAVATGLPERRSGVTAAGRHTALPVQHAARPSQLLL